MAENIPGDTAQSLQLGLVPDAPFQLEPVPPPIETPAGQPHAFDRLHNKWTSLFAVGSALVAFGASPFVKPEAAYADITKQVTIGMPFDGQWAFNTDVSPPYTDSNSSHPSVHHTPGSGDWATDLYSNTEGKVVKLKAKVGAGALSFSWASSTTSCGQSVKINTLVDGQNVGSIYIAHLSDAVTSGNITNGMTLGTVKEITKDGTVCNPGRHVHIEFKNTADYSCYTDHGHPGTPLNEGDDLGVLGSSNKGAKQSCSAAETSGTGSITLARPAAANFNGALNVFTRGGDGRIYTQYWNGTSWTGFSSIGGNMVSDPVAIVNGSALNVFALNQDGQIYTKYNNGSGWTGWASMGSQTMKGNPRVVQYGTELDVFALGTDGHPYKNTWQPTSGWGGWSSLGNYMDSSPAPIAYNGELEVIMRGTDNVIYKDTWNGTSWGGFGAIGSCCLAGNPDAIQYGSQLDVWSNAPAPSNGMWKNTWSGWASTDTNKAVAGDPTVIQSGTELDILVTGIDGKTYKNTKQQGGNWGGFSALPG